MQNNDNGIWLITWYDSWVPQGAWHSKQDVELLNDNSNCVCTTVGYIAKETKTAYVVASSTNGDQWGNLTVIPKASVKDKAELLNF